MKTNCRLLQTVLLASLFFLSLGTVQAETFEVNGIYYSILSKDPEGIVKVVANPEGEPYSGENITIPSTVYYGGLPCKVTSIDPYAFKNSTYSRVTISSPVKSIGQYAFQDCENLTYVKISEEVTAIQPYTFSGCSSLTDVVMPDGIEQIGVWAFSCCSKLAYIYHYSKNVQNGFHLLGWPTSLTNVEACAFQDCNKLPDIPTSLYYIGDFAFIDCNSLTSVRIPATVSYIGTNPFAYCSGIESIVVDSDNPAYDSRSNCNAIVYTNYDRIISGCKNTTIPSDIKSIWSYSFAGQRISSITIGQNVADIGMDAFINCSDLKRVRSLATTPPTCGTDAFGNIDLSSITLYVPNVTKYKSTAPWSEFGNILPLSEWKDYYTITYMIDGEVYATEEVAEGAVITPKEAPAKDGFIFYEWKGLPETMPGNHLTVEAIYTEPITFESNGLWYSLCYKGQVGVITNPSGEKYVGNVTIPETVSNEGVEYSVTSIGSYAFFDCSGLTRVTIPNSVTSIGSYAFRYCSGLTSITIPNSVTSIGSNAFSDCSGLTSIVVEDGNTIYDSRNNCNALIETKTNKLISGCQSTIIPNSVTSIGNGAFSNCSSLTSITIPNSVTSIEYEAFKYCSGLTSITIPNSVTSIGVLAFHSCSGLTSIVVEDGNTVYDSRNNCNALIETKTNKLICGCQSTIIPNSVTSIGDGAFWGYSGLTSITIPNSVTSIEESAFLLCSGLMSITIPNSVTSIGSNAFSDCSGLTSIVVEDGNTVYDSRNNCNAIIETKTNKLICGCQSTIIPNSVTSIGDCAFWNCSDLTSITIPNSVKTIETGTFGGCFNLKVVCVYATIPPMLIIPPNMQAISPNPFNASNTLYVPDESVDAYKADPVWSEKSTILPLSEYKESYTITYMVDGNVYATEEVAEGAVITPKEAPAKDGYICYEWKGLPETMPGNHLTVEAIYIEPITFESDGLWYSTISKGEVGVIANPNGEKYVGSITIPETVINLGKAYTVTRINQDAFKLCYELMDVNIPNTVTAIEEEAFRYSGITKIVIPNSINSIEDGVFLSCAKLTEVTIPYSVNSIKRWAFAGCTSLTSISIPNSVEYIGERAFSASYLTSISVEEGNRVYDSREECNAIIETATNTLIAGCRNTVIPNSIVCIGNSAFCFCTDLVSISIPNSVTSIGNNTFQGCRNLIDITIPTAVESIGNSAFANCSKLTRVRVLGTVPPTCDSLVFSYSPIHEAYLYVPEESIGIYKQKAHWRSFGNILPLNEFKDYYTITYKVDGKVYTTEEMKAGTEISPKEAPLKEGCTFLEWKGLPKRMSGVDIEVEAVYLLEDNEVCYLVAGAEKEIKVIANSNGEKYSGDVIIPETITKGETTYTVTIIEKETFSNCSELASITIPSSIKSIGDDAFLACTNLAAVHITDLVAWCKIAFSNFYSNPLYVAHHLYLNSEEVKDLIIPESVKSIESYAFIGCTSITKAVLPNSLKELGVGVFRECSELKNINIPDSVKSISNNLFQKTNLHSITLHGGIEYIGLWAFGNCDSLKIAYCFSKEPPEYRMAFTANLRPVLYVPISSCENYKTANGWKSFATILPITYKVTYMVDGEEYATDSVYYDEPIIPIDLPAKEGCIFSGWSEMPDTMPAHDIVVTGSFEVNGIDEIMTDTRVDVYNLQGIKIQQQVPFKELENILPKGIYIVNRRKVMIK